MKPVLVIMLKEPRPGRVKTRLGRDIGKIAATWWFRHQSARLIRSLRDPRWQIVLAVAPDLAQAPRLWPGDLPRLALAQEIWASGCVACCAVLVTGISRSDPFA